MLGRKWLSEEQSYISYRFTSQRFASRLIQSLIHSTWRNIHCSAKIEKLMRTYFKNSDSGLLLPENRSVRTDMNGRRRGMGSHQSANAKSETHLTPKYILDALGKFDLDPCAAPNPRPFDTAEEHYTFPEQDGLLLDWHGRVWLNPPYGKALGTWMKKLVQHGTGTALIFARTDTKAFFDTVWDEADAVMFLRGRITFLDRNGIEQSSNGGAPSVLAVYGREDTERLFDSGLDGAIVGLKRHVMIHLAIQRNPPALTWNQLVVDTLRKLGGRGTLQDLYEALEDHPKAQGNNNVAHKIRQSLARAGVERVSRGEYALDAEAMQADLFAEMTPQGM